MRRSVFDSAALILECGAAIFRRIKDNRLLSIFLYVDDVKDEEEPWNMTATPNQHSDTPPQAEIADTSRRDFLVGSSLGIMALALKIVSDTRVRIAESNTRDIQEQELKDSDLRIGRLQRIFERMLGIEATMHTVDAATKERYLAELQKLNAEFEEIRQEHSEVAPLLEPYGSHYLHAILQSQRRIEWDARKE